MTFRYDGLDGIRRSTHVAFSEPSTRVDAVDPVSDPIDAGAVVRLHWELDLEPGAARERRLDGLVERGSDAGRDGRDGRRREGSDPRRRCRCALPRAAARVRRRGRGRVPRLGTRHDRGRQRPRPVQSRDQALGGGPAAPGQRGPRAETSATWRPACRGSRPCSVATRSSRRSSRSRSGRSSRSRRSSVLAAYQATEIDDWRDAEPGKILHELRAGEMARARRAAAHAVLRLGRFDAALADPARRDLRLDRRPRRWSTGCGRTPSPRSTGSTVRRPRRRRVRRVRAPVRARPPEPGLEGLRRRDPLIGTGPRPCRRSRSPRSRATSTTRSAGWPASRASAARPSSPTGSTPRRTHCGRGSTMRSGSRTRATYAMALDRDKKPGGRDRVECRPVPVDRDRRPEPGARRRRSVCWPRRCSPAGASGRTRPGQPGYNPIGYHTGTVWPHDTSLIAAGLKRYGFDERRQPPGRPDLRGRPAASPSSGCPSCSAASIATNRHIPVPYPVACSPQAWAAGVVLPVPRDDARAPGPRRSAASWSCATRTCPTGWAR